MGFDVPSAVIGAAIMFIALSLVEVCRSGGESRVSQLWMIYSDGCPACQRMKPIFAEAQQSVGKQHMRMLSTADAGPSLMQEFNVRAIPHFVAWNQSGKQVDVPFSEVTQSADNLANFAKTLV